MKKVIISVLGFLILAAGIVAGTYLVQKNQDIREKAAPATSLSFFPSSLTKNPGQSISLTINVDSGENKMTGIDITVSFDPAAVQLTSMTPTAAISNLTSIVKPGVIDNTAGTARFQAYTAVKTNAVQGNLDVINITGNVVSGAATGNYPITFAPSTLIAAADEGVNVVINKTPAMLTVSSGSSQSEATETPVPTVEPGGVGGAELTLPTTAPTATATTKATVKPTTAPDDSSEDIQATLPPDVPETGVSLPFLGSMVLGFGALIFSLFLAF